jgi:hypothetical protein
VDIEPDKSAFDLDTAMAIERALAVAMLGLLLVYLFSGTLYGLELVVISVELLMGVLGVWIHSKKEGFIQKDNEFEFSAQMKPPVGPCGNCGEDFRHPVLSADGKYRCPKCAKPVG